MCRILYIIRFGSQGEKVESARLRGVFSQDTTGCNGLTTHLLSLQNTTTIKVYESMLQRLNADLRAAIQEGIDSGPAIAADDVFAELTARYAEPNGKRATKTSGKRST